jgi:hypothetical protein
LGSESDEFLFPRGVVELEAEHGMTLQRLGQPAERLGAGAVLTALDTRDHRSRGAHPLGDVLLRQPKLGAPHDHQPGDLLERREPVVFLAIAGLSRRWRWISALTVVPTGLTLVAIGITISQVYKRVGATVRR